MEDSAVGIMAAEFRIDLVLVFCGFSLLLMQKQLIAVLLLYELGNAGSVEELEVLQDGHLGQTRPSWPTGTLFQRIPEVLVLRVVHPALPLSLWWVYPVVAYIRNCDPFRL